MLCDLASGLKVDANRLMLAIWRPDAWCRGRYSMWDPPPLILDSRPLDCSVLLARPHDSALDSWHAVERVLALMAIPHQSRESEEDFQQLLFSPGSCWCEGCLGKVDCGPRSWVWVLLRHEDARWNELVLSNSIYDLWRYTAGELSKSGGENTLMESIQRDVWDCRDLLILTELLHCFTLRLLWYSTPPIQTNLWPSFSNLVEVRSRPQVCLVGSILFPFRIEVLWEGINCDV